MDMYMTNLEFIDLFTLHDFLIHKTKNQKLIMKNLNEKSDQG